MKDPFVTDSGIDSPSKDSLRNIEGCYNRNIFKGKSFDSSRRALQSGAEKITRTFKCVRNTFGNLSQHFRLGGRRRHRLTEATSPCRLPTTPVNKKKQAQAQAPLRLYSPFGIETPHGRDCRVSPFVPDSPRSPRAPDGSAGARRGAGRWGALSRRPRALFR